MLVIKRFSERKKVFRERKKTGKIHAKRMVVKEIEDGLLEEIEFRWWFEQDIDGENEDDNGKKLVMVNEEGWMRRTCDIRVADIGAFMMSLDVLVEYKHAVMNLTCICPPAATVRNTCRFRLVVEFQRISLIGFRSYTSCSHYRSVSKQTTQYE
ncbi:hypothetical protein Tco_1359853 [Tanacetum coccineum]